MTQVYDRRGTLIKETMAANNMMLGWSWMDTVYYFA